MIKFSDIIKGEFLQEFSAISVGEMLVAIALSFVLSLVVVFVYRITYAGVRFSKNFAGCLILITLVTTVVILVITSNVVLSLGMVGALSIVRFRTAVKEPADTAFLFWAIATGIICGAGYVTIAILATLLLGLLFTGISFLGQRQKSDNYMIVIRYDNECDPEPELRKLPGYRMKNLTMAGEYSELVAEVHLGDSGMQQMQELREIHGVHEVSVMRSVSGSVL